MGRIPVSKRNARMWRAVVWFVDRYVFVKNGVVSSVRQTVI